ncbi:MAG: ArsA family ATPase [Thermodesulfobacteriota bacterium]
MPMNDAEFSGKKLIFVGGKGGVGKTTCSAAIAFHFAIHGYRTLIISSDPTPSLSDIFETPLTADEQQIGGIKNLYALEIQSEAILKKWKARFGPEIHQVLMAFANLDYDFVDYIGGAPGIEEEYMLNFIKELAESGKYERIVWDTAPAGHTLRLLHLPQLFLNHLEAAAKFYLNLYEALAKIAQTVRLEKSKKSILEIIAGWKDLSQEILDFLRDESQTSFILVTIAEGMGVRLTERILKEFTEYGLAVRHLIVNHLIKDADCLFHRRRKLMQEKYLQKLRESYGPNLKLVEVPLLAEEVKGIKRIQEIAGILFA